MTEDERTGSLLVHYDAVRVEADELVGAVANATGLNVKPRRRVPPSEREYIALRVIEATKKLDDLTFEVTGGRVGLGMVVPATLAGMSAFAFVVDKKRRMPRWDNLLYWSYTIFTALHEPEIEAVRKGTERQ